MANGKGMLPNPWQGRPKVSESTPKCWQRAAGLSEFGDDPHCMDYAGNVAEDRKQDIDPEVLGKSHLQEHTQGWEKYGDYDA